MPRTGRVVLPGSPCHHVAQHGHNRREGFAGEPDDRRGLGRLQELRREINPTPCLATACLGPPPRVRDLVFATHYSPSRCSTLRITSGAMRNSAAFRGGDIGMDGFSDSELCSHFAGEGTEVIEVARAHGVDDVPVDALVVGHGDVAKADGLL